MDMIEKDRLIHGHPSENWKDGIEKGFCFKSIAMVGNYGESDDDKNKN
jgi:hypothetical protein